VRTPQELSWLQFNRRVLDQTGRPDFPLLERLRFLAIWASNLDEFFAARVFRPFHGSRGTEAYRALLEEARAQVDLADRTYAAFLPELGRLGIRIISAGDLTREEGLYFGAYLAEEVAPLTDVMPAGDLRDLRTQALYFASGEGVLQYLIRLPDGVPRLLEIPGRDGTYVRLGELLRLRADLFLEGKDLRLYELRVIRLAAIDQERIDWDDLPAKLEGRLDGRVCHLEVEHGFPAHWTEGIRQALGLHPEEVFHVIPPLDLRFVNTIVDDGPAPAKFAPLLPRRTPGFAAAPFRRLDAADLLIFHPYQAYETVEEFAHAAAADPEVTAMRATLYRVGNENGLARALIAAAKAGKDVAVLLEARARFDELTNLEWSLRFVNSGVRVLPLPEKKVHAKVCWVRRAGKEYVHVGTGNYNPRNGRLYTDFSLFTRDARIAKDARRLFDALDEGTVPRLHHMRTGPSIRELLVDRIRAEGRAHGHAILKFNHLTDAEVLAAIAEAAGKGARVDLIVRTTLTEVAPGVHARSLVGRFLEHARVAAFRRGGAWEVWAGSLDAMPRNFDGRYELLFPVIDRRAKHVVLSELRAQLRDDANAFEIDADGTQRRLWGGHFDAQRVQGRATGEAPRRARQP
jgi:polyphosphate kinase